MAKKPVRQKQSYGGCTVDHFSPEMTKQWPKAINVILSFEEAMKLRLALQARLLDINRLNRVTKAGKAAGVNLCVFTDRNRITVNPGKVRTT